jgi:hypothetical protein
MRRLENAGFPAIRLAIAVWAPLSGDQPHGKRGTHPVVDNGSFASIPSELISCGISVRRETGCEPSIMSISSELTMSVVAAANELRVRQSQFADSPESERLAQLREVLDRHCAAFGLARDRQAFLAALDQRFPAAEVHGADPGTSANERLIAELNRQVADLTKQVAALTEELSQPVKLAVRIKTAWKSTPVDRQREVAEVMAEVGVRAGGAAGGPKGSGPSPSVPPVKLPPAVVPEGDYSKSIGLPTGQPVEPTKLLAALAFVIGQFLKIEQELASNLMVLEVSNEEIPLAIRKREDNLREELRKFWLLPPVAEGAQLREQLTKTLYAGYFYGKQKQLHAQLHAVGPSIKRLHAELESTFSYDAIMEAFAVERKRIPSGMFGPAKLSEKEVLDILKKVLGDKLSETDKPHAFHLGRAVVKSFGAQVREKLRD